ncbi:ABC transporter permease [Streptomyces sp. NBC_00690]|uniref:ABC transporter permease n=1 Tax=Streptomyces sp. NBC_00690 TaxID=2975808 RepID=UPI002E2BE94E|nr:FtsX-like permease family protein [Streptomyces sp. NBC_00690]
MSRRGSGALGRVVRSGVKRRRVQTLVIALATMMAVASAVVAGSLMVAADAPFDRAFAQQRGAHITAQYDPAKVSPSQLKDTGRLAGVTASAGPFPATTIKPVDSNGGHLPAVILVGRSTPQADVDALDLKSGRWPSTSGEVVLSASFSGPFIKLGTTVKSSDAADGQPLTVVGFAVSASSTAEAWTTPAQASALASKASPLTSQMLYRFDPAGTKEQLFAGKEKLAAAVPAGALSGTESWLDTKRAADEGAAPTIPFLIAYGALGIVMSVIIVASVVSGAVGTGLRRIGILKAIGFTPREIVRAHVAQALIPAGAGIALGVVLGNLLAMPLLSSAESVYGTASLSVAWWVDLVVPAVALLVVAVAALVPALRAGRLCTVEAIAVGRAPRTGRGQWAHRALGRLPLPRPVTYGLASPFARPVRALAMVLAVAFGTVAATFAWGLTDSLNEVGEARDPEDRAAVTAIIGGPVADSGPPHPDGNGTEPPSLGSGPRPQSNGTEPSSVDPAQVRTAIEAQFGTASYYGKTQADTTVAGVSGRVRVSLYQGDARAASYAMIAGHWITGPGQVVVPSRLLEKSDSEIGDTLRVTVAEHTVPLRIVGESFDTSGERLEIHADLADFPLVEPGVFLIDLKPGVAAAGYADALGAVVQPLGGDVVVNSSSQGENTILILKAMAALLTLMLVFVAGLGVLNSVVLDTRERVHDLGVCKALGMSPRQTVSLVLASVAGLGALGGLIGVPVGFALHGFVLPVMGRAVGTALPPSVLEVFDVAELVLLGSGGVAIAVLGALLPAGWAARVRTATALRTE